jgi:hypothetical protein
MTRQVNRPNPAQLESARRLLAHEGAAGSANEGATTTAGRVYDKLHAHLAPLVGDVGVQLLFVRSAKLAQGEFSFLAEVSLLEGSTKLRERLQARDPALGTESAEALFGTFFALVTTFIGERLTTQVLRRAWPTLEETALTEAIK